VPLYDTQYLLPAILAFLGAVAVVRGHLRSRATKANWRVGKVITEGQLTRCYLVERSEDEAYWCAVEYRVNHILYQLTGVFGFQPDDIGKAVAVAYDPKLPSEARLVAMEEADANHVGAAIGAIVVAAGLFFITLVIVRSFA
jgi:hypothetical protein